MRGKGVAAVEKKPLGRWRAPRACASSASAFSGYRRWAGGLLENRNADAARVGACATRLVHCSSLCSRLAGRSPAAGHSPAPPEAMGLPHKGYAG